MHSAAPGLRYRREREIIDGWRGGGIDYGDVSHCVESGSNRFRFVFFLLTLPWERAVPCTTSHHTTSHHILSHHITSYHTTSLHITPHHTTSHHITSHHTTSHRITSHHITSHHTIPYHTIPYHTTPHHTTPHHTTPTVPVISTSSSPLIIIEVCNW